MVAGTIPLILDGAELSELQFTGVQNASGMNCVNVKMALNLPVSSLMAVLAQMHEAVDESIVAGETDNDIQTCIVKNTFLTVEETSAGNRYLQRTATAPPSVGQFLVRPDAAIVPDELEEEEHDSDEEEAEGFGDLPFANHSVYMAGNAGLARTVTLDMYEDGFPPAWAWADPQAAYAMAMGGPPIDPLGMGPSWNFDPAVLEASLMHQQAMTPGLAFSRTISSERLGPEPSTTISKPSKIAAVSPKAVAEPNSNVLNQSFDVTTGDLHIQWTLDDSAIKKRDDEKLRSPRFYVSHNGLPSIPFDMRVCLLEESEATSKGHLEISCYGDDRPSLKFRVAVCEESRSRQEINDVVQHHFSTSPQCLLKSAVWDFAADGRHNSCVVSLQVISSTKEVFAIPSDRANISNVPPPFVGGSSVVVKNTFLDIANDDSDDNSLLRTQTAPAPAIIHRSSRPVSDPILETAVEDDCCEENKDVSREDNSRAGTDSAKFLHIDPPPLKPQMLHRSFDTERRCMKLEWVISGKKLTSTDTHPHVSPAFGVSFGEGLPSVMFKMMIYPLVINDKKGGASFKKAGGRGYVELVCEDWLPESVPELRFRVAIGTGEKRTAVRGPVAHNFANKAVCGLPKKQALWDFNTVVDKLSNTFVVCLEILASDSPAVVEPKPIDTNPGLRRW